MRYQERIERNRRIMEMRDAGVALAAIAAAVFLHRDTVERIIRRKGATVRTGPADPGRDRRIAAMERLRAEGWTLQAIGDRYGVTRQRVEQILKKRRKEGRNP